MLLGMPNSVDSLLVITRGLNRGRGIFGLFQLLTCASS